MEQEIRLVYDEKNDCFVEVSDELSITICFETKEEMVLFEKFLQEFTNFREKERKRKV